MRSINLVTNVFTTRESGFLAVRFDSSAEPMIINSVVCFKIEGVDRI